ncbi:Universal stress protein [Limnobacter sp. 130]|uniref:universal stress protein n=1 Tax=Limnobacter sp. 130 TaxID=2653147 RepID=UPI0012F474E9|nr:universal stress protein [Limnobacter sp. 130]VWX34815.1 Universal stress protein [Limnobacter sp. 130]
MFTSILLATDASECSMAAAAKAVELAASSKAQLTVVYVSAPYFYLDKAEKAEFNKRSEETANKAFEQIKAMVPKRKMSADSVHTVIKQGKRPSTAILDVAKAAHADLIIMGSHGHSGLNRLMLGSVANEVVTQAKCAVLITK